MNENVTPQKPAIDALSLEPRTGCGYPEPFKSRCLPREKRALGDAFGLRTFGVNYTILQPGKESSMRHWHTHEEEFVFVLSGELVLITNRGEQSLTAGMCVGFPVKSGDGHQLVNRGTQPAVYLEISNRDPADVPVYSDVDLKYDAASAARFTHKDGSPY